MTSKEMRRRVEDAAERTRKWARQEDNPQIAYHGFLLGAVSVIIEEHIGAPGWEFPLNFLATDRSRKA